MSNVRPGQTWADDDPRNAGRTLRVDFIPPVPFFSIHDYAECTVLTVARNVSETQIGTTTRVRLDRFRPGSRGYRLIEDAPES